MMIVVNESAAASYLYLMGLTIDEELPLTQHLSLLPATCKASPDDMINSVMKYGSGDETDLGVLIAVLRKTTAQLRVVGEGQRACSSSLECPICNSSIVRAFELRIVLACSERFADRRFFAMLGNQCCSFYKVVHSKKIESDQRFREAVDKTALSGRMGTV